MTAATAPDHGPWVDIHAHAGCGFLGGLPADHQLAATFGTDRASMVAVGVPLMIVASVATFFTMRMSMRRQSDMSMSNPQTAAMGKIMMYIAPIGALVSGWILPIAVLLYWLANNAWTLGQQHFLTNKVDREQQREKEQEKAKEEERKQSISRPKPGQKPVRSKSSQGAEGSEAGEGSADGDQGTDAERVAPAATSKQNGQSKAKTNGQPNQSGSGKQAGSAKQNQNAHGGKKKSQQQKKRPGKQAASAKKGKKRR